MLDQKKRWVLYYNKFLKSSPDEAPPIPMKGILEELYVRQQAGNSVKLMLNETAAIRITDMTIDQDNAIACLLLQYADTTISDPVFGNLETGELRVEPKLDGEGVAVSAHMLVSLTPTEPRGATYLTLLEDVPGIGKTKIEPFLTSEFKVVSSFTFIDDHQNNKKCRPVVEMAGYLSQSLKDDLDRGVLHGIELVKFSNIENEFDEEGYTEVETYSVKIKLKRKLQGDDALSLLNKIKAKAITADYSKMLVRYNKSEGKQRTIPVSTAREDAGDVLSSRMEIIEVSEPLPQCSSEIRSDIVQKMTLLLIDARGN